MLHVGQLVVCVNGQFREDDMAAFARFGINLPVERRIYTVRAVIPAERMKVLTNGETRNAAVRLFEIVNPPVPATTGGFIEAPFWAGRFRPVKATNIQALERLLLGAPAIEDA